MTQTPTPNGAENTDSASGNVASWIGSREQLERMRDAINAQIEHLDQQPREAEPEGAIAGALPAGEQPEPEPVEESQDQRGRVR